MNFGILGPLELTDADERTLPLGRRMERALLTALLLRANSVVSVDELVEALWPEGPPARPDASLHSVVARLRRTLEPGRAAGESPARLVRVPPGYRLEVHPGELDAERFESLLAAGRAASARDDPAAARGHLADALDLWRGAALAEFAYEPFAEREAARLEELRLAATEERLAADLELGATGLVPELELLVAAHPLRERFWEQLLVALYRAGRQTDAVRRAQDVRHQLAEIGLEPSPGLAALEAAVLRHDPALLAGRRPGPPAPPRPRWWTAGGVRFIGRDHQLDRLADAWRSVVDGDVVVVVISGEPGIGKTWLAAEGAERMADQGALVIAGRCSPGTVVPYEPFVEALGRLVDAMSDEDLRSLGGHAARLADMLPQRAARLGGGSSAHAAEATSEAERYLLFEAVTALVAHVAASAPVVCVIDDLQWADLSTLRLMDHVLRADATSHLLVVTTLRDTDVEPASALRTSLDQITRQHLVGTVALDGFTTAEVDAVLAREQVHTGSAELATTLHAATGGNPFFVVEVVRALEEDAGSAPGAVAVPGTAQALIRSRLSLLPGLAREALATAALVGRRVDPGLIAALVDRPPDEVGAALDDAVHAGLLVSDGDGLWFRHDLVRTELAGSVGPASLAGRHRSIGDALLARARRVAPDDPGVEAAIAESLAHHYGLAAIDGDPRAAVRYARLAGARATERHAHATAATRYEAGLRALDRSGAHDDATRLSLLLDLAESWRRAGELDRCHAVGGDALALALRCGGPSDLRRAAWVVAQHTTPVPGAEGLALETELAEVGRRLRTDPGATDDDRAIVAVARANQVLGRGDVAAAAELAREAMALASAATEPSTIVAVLDLALLALAERLPIGERLDMVARQVEAAGRSGVPEDEMLAHSDARWVHLTAGDVAGAARHATRYEALAERLGMPRYLAGVAQRRAMLAILAGRFREAEALGEETLDHRPDAEFFQGYAAQLAVIRMEEGRSAEIDGLLAQVQGNGQPVWDAARAVIAWEVGDESRAVTILEDLLDRLDGFEPDTQWLATLTLMARVAADLGHLDGCGRLLDLLGPHSGRLVLGGAGAVSLGPVDMVLARLGSALGRPDQARRWLASARRLAADLGAEAMLITADLIEVCLPDGDGPADPASRRELLAAAVAGSELLGVGNRMAERARVALAELDRRCAGGEASGRGGPPP